MDKALEEILSRLERHLTTDKAMIGSEIGALRIAIEQAEANQEKLRFLEAMELRDSVVRNIDEMRSLGFVPSKLKDVIIDGTLQSLLKSTPVKIGEN